MYLHHKGAYIYVYINMYKYTYIYYILYNIYIYSNIKIYMIYGHTTELLMCIL